jgi:hypothetical protein
MGEGEIGDEGFKIIQLGTHMGVNMHAVLMEMMDARLKGAEKSATTGDSQDNDTAEFAQNLLPSLEGNTLVATKIIENGAQLDVAVAGQFQGCLAMSMSQPSRSFMVLQHPSPLRSFLMEMGS